MVSHTEYSQLTDLKLSPASFGHGFENIFLFLKLKTHSKKLINNLKHKTLSQL
jgi:hypothetical protein